MNVSAWEQIRLGEVLEEVSRPEIVNADKVYRVLGMRWYAKGVFVKEERSGGDIKASKVYRVEEGDFIYNRLFAWKGSFAVVGSDLAGSYVSNEFPCFRVNVNRANPEFVWKFLSQQSVWKQIEKESSGSSRQSRLRLKQEKFLSLHMPLPKSVEEQRQIVTSIDTTMRVVDKVKSVSGDSERGLEGLLKSAYHELAAEAEWKPFAEVAKLHRRKVITELDGVYKELGVRSFGKGTFHKPALTGTELGSKRIFHIEPGDLVFNIVFAWEGAVAVVKPEDAGRVGSHRFLTYVPDPQQATAKFLAFHFLTYKGLEDLGKASPGAAGRNKTLGVKALENIKVPVPPVTKQQWFDKLIERRDEVMRIKREAALELAAVEPALLQRAFSFAAHSAP